MEIVPVSGRLPSPAAFVAELRRRLDLCFAEISATISGALLRAGADSGAVARLARDPAAKGAFLIGCCAEEVASVRLATDGHLERRFSYAVADMLRDGAGPIEASRVSMDYLRLLSDFRAEPAGSRLRVVEYMLDIGGMKSARKLLAENQVSRLAIEMTVLSDSITGTLAEMMTPTQPQSIAS